MFICFFSSIFVGKAHLAQIVNMVKSSKWCLNRINYDGTEEKVFRLNEGDTTIGRNKAADITSTSTICSRNQCVISLISDKVTLSNKVIGL